MPLGIPISFEYRGTAIPSDGGPIGVIFARTRLNVQINAQVGEFEVYVRDPNIEMDFVTGGELIVKVDGIPIFGGFVTVVGRTHHFPAFRSPTWILRGVDYNILFDKRFIRNPDNYLEAIDPIPGDTMDGEALRTLIATYADMDGFDSGDEIDDIQEVIPNKPDAADIDWQYFQQGTRIRVQFDVLAKVAGAIFYFGPDRKINYHPYDDLISDWGFSDDPNDVTMFGFREGEVIEDGSVIVNDALVWGGSELAGAGGTVFARTQDATSITDHGRWQWGENHVGEEGYGNLETVQAHADAIVIGPAIRPETPVQDRIANIGRRYSQWQAHLGWFHHRVPTMLTPGMIVPIELSQFGETRLLPLRNLAISFPTLDSDGKTYVRYDGDFSLLQDDPFSLWSLLLRTQFRQIRPFLGASTDDSTSTIFGAYGSFTPTNVSGLVYKVKFGYVNGTLMVYSNGLLLTPGVDFTETDSIKGEFTLEASHSGLYATCRTLGS